MGTRKRSTRGAGDAQLPVHPQSTDKLLQRATACLLWVSLWVHSARANLRPHALYGFRRPPAQISTPGPRAALVSKHFIVSLLLLGVLASAMIGARLIENEPTRPDLESRAYQLNETKETLRKSEVKLADVASDASVNTASEIAPANAPAPAIAEQQPVDGTLAATPVIAPPSAPIESSEIIEFQGRDTAKKSGSIYIHASAAVTVIKKRKDSSGEGDRIELPRGAERRIPISSAEVIGVAEGEGFKVYFQGQLVPPSMFRAGRWVRFIAAR